MCRWVVVAVVHKPLTCKTQFTGWSAPKEVQVQQITIQVIGIELALRSSFNWYVAALLAPYSECVLLFQICPIEGTLIVFSSPSWPNRLQNTLALSRTRTLISPIKCISSTCTWSLDEQCHLCRGPPATPVYYFKVVWYYVMSYCMIYSVWCAMVMIWVIFKRLCMC